MEPVVAKHNGNTNTLLKAISGVRGEVSNGTKYSDNSLLLSPIHLLEGGASYKDSNEIEMQNSLNSVVNNRRGDLSLSIRDNVTLDMSIDGVEVTQSLQTALSNIDVRHPQCNFDKTEEGIFVRTQTSEVTDKKCSVNGDLNIFRNSNISEETSSFIGAVKCLNGGIEELLGGEQHPLLQESYKKRQSKKTSLQTSIELFQNKIATLTEEVERLRETVVITSNEEDILKEYLYADSDKYQSAIETFDETIHRVISECEELELERIKKLKEVYGVVVTAKSKPSCDYTCQWCDVSCPLEAVVPGNDLLVNVSRISKEIEERVLNKEMEAVSALRNELDALHVCLQDLGIYYCDHNITTDETSSISNVGEVDRQFSSRISSLKPSDSKDTEEHTKMLETELTMLKEIDKLFNIECDVRRKTEEQELNERLALCPCEIVDQRDCDVCVHELLMSTTQYIDVAVQNRLEKLDEKIEMEKRKGEASDRWIKAAERLIAKRVPCWWKEDYDISFNEKSKLLSPKNICDAIQAKFQKYQRCFSEKETILKEIEMEILHAKNSEQTKSDYVSGGTHDFDKVISLMGAMTVDHRSNGVSPQYAIEMDLSPDYRVSPNDGALLHSSSSSDTDEDYAALLPRPLSIGEVDYTSNGSSLTDSTQLLRDEILQSSSIDIHRAIEGYSVVLLPTIKNVERITNVVAVGDISKASIPEAKYDNIIPLRKQKKIIRWWEREKNKYQSQSCLFSEENDANTSSTAAEDRKVCLNIMKSYSLENLLTKTSRALSCLQERRSELNAQAAYDQELEERSHRGGVGKLAAIVGRRGTTVSAARYLRALFGTQADKEVIVTEEFELYSKYYRSNANKTDNDISSEKNNEIPVQETSPSQPLTNRECTVLRIPCVEPMHKRLESLRKLNSLTKELTALYDKCHLERDEIQQLRDKLGEVYHQDANERINTIKKAKLERHLVRSRYIIEEEFMERENDRLDSYIHILKQDIKENILALIGIPNR